MAGFFESTAADLRYSLRMARRNPAVSATIVVSLALGIGANTAVFSVAEALLLRPFPYPEPDRLVDVWVRSPGIGISQDWVSPGEFIDIRDQTRCFSELAIAYYDGFNLTGAGRPERVDGMRASSSLFRLLGARPIRGRLFGPTEDSPAAFYSAVLTYGAWKRYFSGDPNIVGRSINLNSRAFTVLGVLDERFELGPDAMPSYDEIHRAEIFIPLALPAATANNRLQEMYNVIGRLAPGVTLERARSEVDAVASRIRDKDRRDRTFGIVLRPLAEQLVGEASGNIRGVVLTLLAGVGLVLLIACGNAANLLLSRAMAREREAAIRVALGAGRGRLARQLLTESIFLSLLGGGLGTLLGFGLIAAIQALQPGNLPRMGDIGLNATVLAFTFAVAAATGVLFGLAPALRISAVDPNSFLRSGGRGLASGHASDRLRAALAAGEMALALILLVGAGLLLRSFSTLRNAHPGFDPASVVSMRVALRSARYPRRADVIHFFDSLRARLSASREVSAVGAITTLPMSGAASWGPIEVEGAPVPPGQPEVQAETRYVTPGYFETMRIPVAQGRAFDERDTASGRRVAVVDRSFAKRFWPGRSAIGGRVRIGGGSPEWAEVVGVVGDVLQYGAARENRIAFYVPHSQNTAQTMYIVARGGPNALPATLSAIRSLDPDLPVYSIAAMQSLVDASLARERFAMSVLGGFAGAALLLAAIGIYGVMSYLVTQSTHDIGVRAALGATPAAILSMVLGRGMRVAGAGLAAGLAGAWALTRLMASMLHGVAPTDPIAFLAAPALLAAIAIVSTSIPAFRAAALDPIQALREE